MTNHVLALARLSGALSCFGSMWIIVEILIDRKKRSTCYQRILWGLCFFDLLSSFWFFMANWGQPAQHGSMFVAYPGHGNEVTCQMSGFFIYLGGLTIPAYNAALSWYYYLAICCQWNENRIKKNFERYVHLLIGPVAVIIATVPIFMDVYKPYYFYCFAAADLFQLFYWVSVFCNSSSSLYAMICIVIRVRRTLQRSDSYDFRPQTTTRSLPFPSIKRSRRNRRRKHIAASVSTTAILYTIPFLFTWVIPMAWNCFLYLCFRLNLGSIHNIHTMIYPMQVYMATVLPLQGFLNFLVYKRFSFRVTRLWTTAVKAILTVNLHCCYKSSNADKEDNDNVNDNDVSENQIVNSSDLSLDHDGNETKNYVDNGI